MGSSVCYTKTMKKFLTVFFVTLGIIFFGLLLVGGYLYVADPFNLKPLLSGEESAASSEIVDTVDQNSVLNPNQERVLETVGIDPAAVPTKITPEQAACFVEVLGQARVDEIIAGATPSLLEILRARSCIE